MALPECEVHNRQPPIVSITHIEDIEKLKRFFKPAADFDMRAWRPTVPIFNEPTLLDYQALYLPAYSIIMTRPF
jgi:hypothetical protein